MGLNQGVIGEEYYVKELRIDDKELKGFLFTLGCFKGEPITVISRKKNFCIVSIKEGRYCIDNNLASSIII